MIDLIVKTLDSRNHGFAVEDETTVQQLKDKIQETMNIPAASQRLIYCGRVLQDEKKLSDYDVNGKVIHLVKSQPPQPGRRPAGSGNSSENGNNNARSRHAPRRMDGNAMFGSVVIPVESGLLVQGVQGSPQNRAWRLVTNADQMVQRANEVIDRIENPNATPSTSTSAVPSTTTTPYNSSRDSSGSHSPTTEPQPSGRLSLITESRAATSTATPTPAGDTDMEAESGTGPPHITVSSADPNAATTQSASTSSSGVSSQSHEGSTQDSNRRQLREGASPNNLAILLDKLRTLHNRLNPLLSRYHHILCEDPPTTPDNPQITTERQNIASSVPEVLHLLSHAYHSISELSIDMEAAPPRQVRASTPPIHQLVQQFNMSTPGQTVTAHIPGGAWTRQTASTASRAATGTTTAPTSTTAPSSSPSPTVAAPEMTFVTAAFPVESGEPAARVGAEAETGNTNPTAGVRAPATATVSLDASAHALPGIRAALTAAVNMAQAHAHAQAGEQTQTPGQPSQQQGQPRGSSIVAVPMGMIDIPSNVEFFMEVVPSSVTIDSMEATVVTSGNFTPGTNAEGGSMGFNFPWGGPPPQEFLEGVMQAVGHLISSTPTMRRRGSAPESTLGTPPASASGTTASSTSPSVSASSPSGSGQTSQARGYTATHPTTSTQTRSTSRPHVHHIATTQFPTFRSVMDPFLPCQSSFFMQHQRRRSHASAQTSQPTTQTSANPTQSSTSSTNAAAPQHPTESSAPRAGATLLNAIPPSMAERSLLSFARSMGNRNFRSGVEALTNILSSLAAGSHSGTPPEVPVIDVGSVAFEEDQEGQSLLSDLRLTVVRSVTMSDFVALSMRQWETLSHIRTDLRQFVLERVMEGEPATEERMERGVNLLLNELRPHFDVMLEARLRDDIDAVATMNRFHEAVIPEFLHLVLDDDRAANFGQNIHDMVRNYLARLWVIAKYCCANSEEGLETIIQSCVNRMPNSVPLASWTAQTLFDQLRLYMDIVQVPLDDIQKFIVYRTSSSCATTSAPVASPTRTHAVSLSDSAVIEEEATVTAAKTSFGTHSCSVNAHSSQTEPSRSEPTSTSAEPMETDPQSPPQATTSAASTSSLSTPSKDISPSSSSEEAVTAKTATSQSPSSSPSAAVAMDTDVPPVPPPEAWHRILPPEWVPIIARDATRQRRPNTQAPLSDAYLAGMPAKRRKVVTASKPQGTLSQVISANMEQAIQSSGVSTVRVARIQEEAGRDQRLQEAYREQLRSTVRANLDNNPDFSPERFPNAARYFGKS